MTMEILGAHFVNDFITPFDSGKYLVPLPPRL